MPVAALSRKCKSSRLKAHSVTLPKNSNQPVDSICQYVMPPQASDPNQPLDLSVKTRPKEGQSTEAKYLSFSCQPDFSGSSVGGASGSSLADLEKKFGNASAIFDRIGTKTWASPFCGALVSRLGVNLYSAKLHGAFVDSTSAFGVGMIPVPVQRFNSTLATTSAKTEVSSLPAKLEQTELAGDMEAGCRASEPGFQWHHKHPPDASSSDQRKHTNFQCSCGAELETLYHLTMHLQQTGHAPNKLKNVGRQEYSKLVRGQDMWLNHGCEQTRQILRCMECDESFKSLPELTVHMIQTKHYANIVGADALQRKIPSKGSENRSEPSSDGSETNRVHCLVCLEPFDDAEALGSHIVESGHYQSTPDEAGTPKESSCHSGRGKRHSRSLTPVDPATPQSGAEDIGSMDGPPSKTDHFRKRDHSASESSPFDDYGSRELSKRCRSVRHSDSEDGPPPKAGQEKKPRDREGEFPLVRFPESDFDTERRSSSVGFKEALELISGSPADNDSLPESCDDACFKPQIHQRSVRSESEKSCRPVEEPAEAGANSSAFHLESFFRPASTNSSSDGSAIRAMETFIKNSFGSAETKHRAPALHPLSQMDSSSLVGSLISRFGCYMDNLKLGGGQNSSAGRQESRASESLENSNLYQNKYLPPVYIAPIPEVQADGEKIGQVWSASRKIKSESVSTTPQIEAERQSLDSEGLSRESENSTRELERPGSGEKRRKVKRSSQRPDLAVSPDHFRKSEADSLNRENFLCGMKSNKSIDLKAPERTKAGLEIEDVENDERPSSTSNNNPSRSSALESLQGLVYGKALNSEHPLDSLQKLIYGRGGGSGVVHTGRQPGSGAGPLLNGANGSHTAVIMKGAEALSHPLPPGTLILVNPIVTVVPGASGSNPSLNITLPGCESSPVAKCGGGEDGIKHPDQGRRLHSPLDDRENNIRIYRCRGCRRKFSSKGSYRYHLSRCHAFTSSSSSEKRPSMKEHYRKSPYICLPLDATPAKFNKYYKLANELSTEAK